MIPIETPSLCLHFYQFVLLRGSSLRIVRGMGSGIFVCIRCGQRFATRCLEAGLHSKTIQLWLGHARLDMTMNPYVDGWALLRQKDGFLREEAQKFAKKWH